MRPAHLAHLLHLWIAFAFLAFFPVLANAYTTPGTGVDWTADDLVAESGGIVVWNSEENRYESTEFITVASGDSLTILQNFYIDDFNETDFLVHGALRIGDPVGEPTDSVALLGEEVAGFDNGPGGIRLSGTGRAYLTRVILIGGGAIGLSNGIWVEEGYAELQGCRIGDWIGSGVRVTQSGEVVMDDCQIHEMHGYSLYLDGRADISNTTFEHFNLVSPTLDYPAVYLPSNVSPHLDMDHCTILGSEGNAAGGIHIDNQGEQDQDILIQNSLIENCAYGIWISGAYSSMNVVACSLRTNTALEDHLTTGAGLLIESGASVYLADNVVTGNYAGVRLEQTIPQPLALQMGEAGSEYQLARGFNTILDNGYDDQIIALENRTAYDVTAQNNYWGSSNPEEINGYILDQLDNEEYGLVSIQPLWDGVSDNLAPQLSGLLPETDHPRFIRLQQAQFRANATDPDGDDEALHYSWTKAGEEIATDTTQIALVFSTEDPTPLEVQVTVTDQDDRSTTYTWYVTLLNLPPPTLVTITPDSSELNVEPGSEVFFELVGDVNGRYDLLYRVDRNNETVSDTGYTTLTFDTVGDEEVSAYVWYEVEEGYVASSYTWNVHVYDISPPVINTALPDSSHPVIDQGTMINFYLEAEVNGPWTLNYEYRIGEEVISEFQDCAYRFNDVGNHTVDASIWYGEGGEGRTVTHSWEVTVLPPSDVDDRNLPTQFGLETWPNPFNAQLSLEVALPQHENVTVDLYDVTGRQVKRLVSAQYDAGRHRIGFEAGNLPSGLYFIRLHAGEFAAIRKIMLVR